MPGDLGHRFGPIARAFCADGYEVCSTETYQGYRGALARSLRGAKGPGDGGKLAYYLEGSPYAMGRLMGLLAEPSVKALAIDFTANFLPTFINPNLVPERFQFVFRWLVDLIDHLDKSMIQDYPADQLEELHGLADGCRAANPSTKVDFDHLWTLNVALDYLCAIAYASDQLLRRRHGALDSELARKIIDFLGPQGCFPSYDRHSWDEDPDDWRRQIIQGATSLFDLTEKTVTSHWGRFGDAWVDLDLKRYQGL